MSVIIDEHGNLTDQYRSFIALSRYARWLPEHNRRETWQETVWRYIEFFMDRGQIDEVEAQWLFGAILNHQAMPSMRALMTAGEALNRDNVAGFNCSYTPIGGGGDSIEVLTPEMEALGFDKPITINVKDPRDFDELMYVLLCGTGVGFSVERIYHEDLPVVGHSLPRSWFHRRNKSFPGVPKHEISTISRTRNAIIVEDSKYGWASALRILIVELYNGNFDIKWDTSKVRPAGTPLKTFGGRASGPEPLESLFKFAVELFTEAEGRRLNSVECHDLTCKIADIVVVGGVRRSALISLSNLSDGRMAKAKSGRWWDDNPQRALANNSICYTVKPTMDSYLTEFLTLYQSGSGERGIFNREAARKQAEKNGRRDPNYEWGTNPCSEIILRPRQFCNLSEIVVRNTDGLFELEEKAKTATVLGTLQASLTDFRYLRPEWKKNTEEEALLGVSMTGIMDHPVLSEQVEPEWLDWKEVCLEEEWEGLPSILEYLKNVCIKTNEEWADRLGINRAAAITAVKPSGTVSQLVDSASGIHPRYSGYYIRTVRADVKDPLSQLMVDAGFPHEVDVINPSNLVFSFPIKAPEGGVMRDDRTAIQQLEHWLIYQRHWCEHKPSITVYVRDEEWPEVSAWVWEHFDEVSGVSFLPHTDHTYAQAPYQEITRETYELLAAAMPTADWSDLGKYEKQDTTRSASTMACVGGSCEIVDLT